MTPSTTVNDRSDRDREETDNVAAATPYVRAAIDAFPGSVAVLDRAGYVAVVNAAWEGVAQANGAAADHARGANYKELCEAGAAAGESAAGAVGEALQAILDGRSDRAELDYTLPEGNRRAWYRVALAPWNGPGPFGAIACHTKLSGIPSGDPSIRGVGEAPNTEGEAKDSAIDHSLISMTDRDGLITYVNDRFCEISGYERRALIGRTHRIVNSGVHSPEFFSELWRTIESGRIWKGTICNRDRAGRLIWLAATIAPVRDVSGAIAGYISVRHDHTELEQARRAVEAKNRELEELVYTVSHDLKNPLVTIGGYIRHLDHAVERGDIEQAASHGGRIRRAAERMRRTIDEILQLCRFGAVPIEPRDIEVEPLFREVLEQFPAEIESRGIRIRSSFSAPVLKADPEQVKHALQNLLANALRYGCSEKDPEVLIATHHTPGGVTLVVSDNGPGIEPEHHDRVFRAFTRLGSDGGGTGLGLAIVRRIADAHRGNVHLQSQPGKGARFSVHFPGLPADTCHASIEPAEPDPATVVSRPADARNASQTTHGAASNHVEDPHR